MGVWWLSEGGGRALGPAQECQGDAWQATRHMRHARKGRAAATCKAAGRCLPTTGHTCS